MLFKSSSTFYIAKEHVRDPCEPDLKKSRNVLSEESIECDKVSNKGSREESCCEEPVPPESGCVSMEVHSEIGEENLLLSVMKSTLLR